MQIPLAMMSKTPLPNGPRVKARRLPSGNRGTTMKNEAGSVSKYLTKKKARASGVIGSTGILSTASGNN
jgi:hypothetical protein